jgi:tetratricopeptide (TPR) repeat protein
MRITFNRRKVMSKAEMHEKTTTNPDALAAFERGDEHFESRDYKNAIEKYTEAIRLDPDYADAYSSRGTAYCAEGDYDKAIDDYNEAIRIKPDYAIYYSSRSYAIKQKKGM